jgi:hypothetical protein
VPAALVLNSARWFAPKPPPEPTLLPSGPPSAEPREERPIAARPEAAAPEPITDPLQRIVSAIGDDTLIEICVEQHRARFPDEVVRLEVHLEPPNEVVAVEVGPPSLQDAEVVSCLEHATMVLALREVTLERPGSVIIAFD